MKLLVVSHPCVTPINQEFFAEVKRQSGWDLTLVLPSSWDGEYGTRHAERWPAFKGDMEPVPVWLSGNIPLHIYRTLFISLLRRVQPDVIYVHHEPYAAATAQMYVANRLSVQSPIGFFTWQNLKKRYPPPFRQLERMVYRQSHFALSGSESAREVLRQKGYRGPAPIVPAGIDPDHYTTSPRDSPAPDGLKAIIGDGPVIGFVGRMTEEKGLGTLVRALSRVDVPSWKMVFIGTGPYEKTLREEARQVGITDQIHFLGYVPHTDIPDYLARLDLVVLPSETQSNWKEQFGRILIESMACGTPVLGSDSGEIPYLIQRTGGGRTFPEGDATACAQQLTRLLRDDDLRAALAQKGRDSVYNRYTHAALARAFIDTIESL